MLIRLVSNSQPQVIRLPRPPNVLGLQGLKPSSHLSLSSTWGYRCTLPHPANFFFLILGFAVLPRLVLNSWAQEGLELLGRTRNTSSAGGAEGRSAFSMVLGATAASGVDDYAQVILNICTPGGAGPYPPRCSELGNRRSLALSPGWSAVTRSRLTATSVFPVSSNSPASASRVARTTGTHHHVRLIFCTLVETGFHRVGQDGLDLLTSYSWKNFKEKLSASEFLTGVMAPITVEPPTRSTGLGGVKPRAGLLGGEELLFWIDKFRKALKKPGFCFLKLLNGS
ncbi:hypothetical protein AAY473_001510 [Plecturocebus cupreus]